MHRKNTSSPGIPLLLSDTSSRATRSRAGRGASLKQRLAVYCASSSNHFGTAVRAAHAASNPPCGHESIRVRGSHDQARVDAETKKNREITSQPAPQLIGRGDSSSLSISMQIRKQADTEEQS